MLRTFVISTWTSQIAEYLCLFVIKSQKKPQQAAAWMMKKKSSDLDLQRDQKCGKEPRN